MTSNYRPIAKLFPGDQLPWFHDEDGRVAYGTVLRVGIYDGRAIVTIFDPEEKRDRKLEYGLFDELLVEGKFSYLGNRN